MSDLDKVVATVASSKKYRAVCADTVRRIAEREMDKHNSLKAATKATKRKLHQSYGAFEQDSDYEVAYARLEAAYATGPEAEIQAACWHVLGLHSSTRERRPLLDRFYLDIWAVTGRPASILDLGCGLNPLSLPWMDLSSERSLKYVALDIDENRIVFLNRYLTLAGLEPLARCQDILIQTPQDQADVALLLKMSPSLERQEQGTTLRLIERLQAPNIVVSYAIKSLGGREKGMLTHYHQQFSEWAEGRHWAVEELVFETELVFVVRKQRISRFDGSRNP